MGAHHRPSERPLFARGVRAPRPHRRTGLVTAAVLGTLLSVSAVWMNSYAAFSGTTQNPGNAWTAGSVTLTNDAPAATAMFNATGLTPGATGQKCIVVTYNGNVAAAVKVYATGYAQTNGLGGHLGVTIEQGTGSSFTGSGPASCTGFTVEGAAIFSGTADAFGNVTTGKTNYATGVGTFAPTAGGQAKTYRITYTLNASTPDSAQGGKVDLGFVWEAQNT